MKKAKRSEQEIVGIMRKIETAQAAGKTIAQAAKSEGITEQTYFRWKKRYGGMGVPELKRLKELERENAANLRFDSDAASATPSIDSLSELALVELNFSDRVF